MPVGTAMWRFDMSATASAVRSSDVSATANAARGLEGLDLLCMLALEGLHFLRVLAL